MSKRVLLVRHSIQEKSDEPMPWQPNAPLSDDGWKLVRRVRDKHLTNKKFAVYGASPAVRAKQTAEGFAGDRMLVKTYPELTTPAKKAWDWVFKGRAPYPDSLEGLNQMFEAEAIAPLMIAEGQRLFEFVRDIATYSLSPDKEALLVGHYPFIPCAVAFATWDWPPKLWVAKAGIVVMEFGTFHNQFIGW